MRPIISIISLRDMQFQFSAFSLICQLYLIKNIHIYFVTNTWRYPSEIAFHECTPAIHCFYQNKKSQYSR